MKVFKITSVERTALRVTGYEQLGDSLKDLSEVFVNTSLEQLAEAYINDLDAFDADYFDALDTEDEYNEYKEHLETIIFMIKRITGLDYTFTFVGDADSFERLNNTRIK